MMKTVLIDSCVAGSHLLQGFGSPDDDEVDEERNRHQYEEEPHDFTHFPVNTTKFEEQENLQRQYIS